MSTLDSFTVLYICIIKFSIYSHGRHLQLETYSLRFNAYLASRTV